ncbi:MAG: TRAP transporter small permease subunit [Rhizobiales bacterium]|nr:TRAP transporter small permease subunit [Hyphomicrobiales bacterium]
MGTAACIDRALNRLYLAAGFLAAGAIVFLALLVAASVAARFLGIYVGGLTEGAGYATAAAGSLGLAWSLGTGGHIRVDLALNALSDAPRRRLDQFAFLVTAGTMCFAAWYLARMVAISWDYGDLSVGSDRLPIWLPQLPVALGFVIFAVALVHGALKYLVRGSNPIADEGPDLLAADDRSPVQGR